jgi:hypothetical protein
MFDSRSGKYVDIVVHLTFLTLIGFAAHFWLERLIYVDSALQFFEWVQYDHLVVQQGNRWPAIFPQLVVKLFRAFGSGLRVLAVVASVSYAVWPYLMFLLTRYVLKARIAGIMMALAMVLFARHSFYEMVLETQLLAVYPIMLFGWMESGRRVGGWAMGVLLFCLCLFVHPVGPLAGLGMVAFGLATQRLGKPIAGLFLLLAASWLLIRHALLPISGYEQGFYGSLTGAIASPGTWWQLPQVKNFIDHSGRLSSVYLPGLILGCTTVAFLSYRRRWKALVLFISMAVGYFLLVTLTYNKGESALMLEKNLIFLGAWISANFIWALAELGNGRALRWLVPIALLLVIGMKLRDISLAGRIYTTRLSAIREIVVEASPYGSKFLVTPATLEARGVWIEWAVPFETLLLSSIEMTNGVTAICLVEGVDTMGVGQDEVLLPPTASPMDQTLLNPKYFSIRSGRYVDFEKITERGPEN